MMPKLSLITLASGAAVAVHAKRWKRCPAFVFVKAILTNIGVLSLDDPSEPLFRASGDKFLRAVSSVRRYR